jgi:hypothetical protein
MHSRQRRLSEASEQDDDGTEEFRIDPPVLATLLKEMKEVRGTLDRHGRLLPQDRFLRDAHVLVMDLAFHAAQMAKALSDDRTARALATAQESARRSAALYPED